jgi:hypothetical protein
MYTLSDMLIVVVDFLHLLPSFYISALVVPSRDASLLQGVVEQELGDKVYVGQHHAPTAIPTQAQFV